MRTWLLVFVLLVLIHTLDAVGLVRKTKKGPKPPVEAEETIKKAKAKHRPKKAAEKIVAHATKPKKSVQDDAIASKTDGGEQQSKPVEAKLDKQETVDKEVAKSDKETVAAKVEGEDTQKEKDAPENTEEAKEKKQAASPPPAEAYEVGTEKFKHYSFRVTALREKENTIVQLSELYLIVAEDGKDKLLNSANVAREDGRSSSQPQYSARHHDTSREGNFKPVSMRSGRREEPPEEPELNTPKDIICRNPTGNNPFNEGPDALVDNNAETKWLQFHFQDMAEVVFDLHEPQHITHIQMITANDDPGRDPISFQFAASHDKVSWVTLLHVENFKPPLARQVQTQKWELKTVAPVAVESYAPAVTAVDTLTKITFKGGNGGDDVKVIQSSKDCAIKGLEFQTEGFTNAPMAMVTIPESGVYNVCYKAKGAATYTIVWSQGENGNFHVTTKPKASVPITII
eukprot:TRINITY_DN67253_c4_g2_i1.p1 TRINITY_DN67253_c4_g2~~TRINITY_DN67253_c4_g2_i1.p1  ORF type:complete len:474 (+),score=70.73 TRINITY_DN67253_c4_g2_i1:50-1423(+)